MLTGVTFTTDVQNSLKWRHVSKAGFSYYLLRSPRIIIVVFVRSATVLRSLRILHGAQLADHQPSPFFRFSISLRERF